MFFIYGMFRKARRPTNVEIISSDALQNGTARIGDLVEVVGGCPRYPGDRCDLVGGYASVVIEYKGELFYRIVD